MSDPSPPANSRRLLGPERGAYAVGRYAPAVRLWLDVAAVEARAGVPATPGRRSRPPGRGPVDRALRGLAVGGRVRPAVLVEMHRAVDSLSRRCTRVWRAHRAGRLSGDPAVMAQAVRWAEVIEGLVGHLIPAGEMPDGWLRLGASLGGCRRACWEGAVHGAVLSDETPDRPMHIAARLLRDVDLPSLRAIASLPAEPPPDAGDDLFLEAEREFHHRGLELARLDRNLGLELQAEDPPLPVLILEPDRLVFRGEASRSRVCPNRG